jgi:hypothetical protein
MATSLRWLAVTGCVALATALAACATSTPGQGGGAPHEPSPPGPTSPAPPSSPGPSPAATPQGTTTAFVLAEGKELNLCGIRVTVRFIPPSVNGTSTDQAFLVVADKSGDQPVPANVAPARAGATVTVAGRRFRIDAVDLVNRRVSGQALC